MPVTRDSPSIQGDVPGPTPPGSPSNAVAGRGSLVGGAAGGGLPCQAGPRGGAPLPRRVERAWSTFGPHAIGTERFATVSSGPSFAQLAGPILGEQARVQNPDKDEVPGSSTASHELSQPRCGLDSSAAAPDADHMVWVGQDRDVGQWVGVQGDQVGVVALGEEAAAGRLWAKGLGAGRRGCLDRP
jgi:hypothetical protein